MVLGGGTDEEAWAHVQACLDRYVQRRAVSDELGDAVLVGAGSVIDGPTAQAAIDAGARYVVSPVFKREVIDAAHAMGAAAMPGLQSRRHSIAVAATNSKASRSKYKQSVALCDF